MSTRHDIKPNVLIEIPPRVERVEDGYRAYEDILNYNIRMMIYDYLELAPISCRFGSEGLTLSCKAACGEVRAAAARQLIMKLAYFRRTFTRDTGLDMRLLEIPLYGPWKDIRNVTLELPPTALRYQALVEHLRPLFQLHLINLFIMFKGSGESVRSLLEPDAETTRGLSCLRNYPNMPWLAAAAKVLPKYMRLTQEMILNARKCPHCNGTHVAIARRYNGAWELHAAPERLLYVQNVTFAWDFRSEEDAAEGRGRRKHLLQGQLIQTKKSIAALRRERFKMQKDFMLPVRYELTGRNGLVGAWGHKSRFSIAKLMNESTRSRLMRDLYHDKCVQARAVASDDFGQTLEET